MTRKQAITVGLICGLVLGPFVGCVELAIVVVITDATLRYQAITYPIFLLPFAILMFGLPGAVAGALSGWAVHAMSPTLKSRLQIVVSAALIGAILAMVAVGALKLFRFQIEWIYLLLAGSSGFLTGSGFGLWFSHANSQPLTTNY